MLEIDLSMLLKCLTMTYDTINGKPTSSMQQHDILLFLTDNSLHLLLRCIAEEIEFLPGKSLDVFPAEFNSELWSQSRGYLISTQTHDINQFGVRELLLYEALTDVLTQRLIYKKKLKLNVWLQSTQDDTEKQLLSLKTHCIYVIQQIQPKQLSSETQFDSLNLLELLHEIQSIVFQINLQNRSMICSLYICPFWDSYTKDDQNKLYHLTDVLNQDYYNRRCALIKRFDITVSTFLWSHTLRTESIRYAIFNTIVSAFQWRYNTEQLYVYIWDVLTATQNVITHEYDKISSLKPSIKDPVKSFLIGSVPDRGGLLEGYTSKQIQHDVYLANQALRQKNVSTFGSKRHNPLIHSPDTDRQTKNVNKQMKRSYKSKIYN